ncbi:uncharacterized protein TNCV_2445881 [Trichonephila clavipes]|nr:uncharacterized protein TNCV_2445881 [Trichonephila clavipes]
MTFAAVWTLSSETMAVAILNAASQTGVFYSHQDSRIRVWRHRGERTLATCIRHSYTGPLPAVIVWFAIGYTSQSPFVRIDGTLNSARHISGVLRTVTLPFIRALCNPTFQQDNARPHVAGIVQTFLEMENVQLLPWPAC